MSHRERTDIERFAGAACIVAILLLASDLSAQESAPAPRPPEGSVIINLPSADVPRAGTLSLLFTHRFSQALADSDVHSLFSFDSGADIGIGLAYTPLTGLDLSLYRSSNLDVYEAAAKYRIPWDGPVHVAVRGGGDFRTDVGPIYDAAAGYSRRGFFGQAILAYDLFDRVRVTAVPTYVSSTSGQPLATPRPAYKHLFQVPTAISVRVLRTVNIQGEVYPALGKADSSGVGWVCAIEKTVPGHRFAFTVGSVRSTTTDQYVFAVPPGGHSHDYFIGFNLVRQWKLK